MTTEILTCGYSYHFTPFTTGGRHPLTDYLFRLQTEGTSSAYVKGQLIHLQAGHLILLQPGDSYELCIEADENGIIDSGDYYLVCSGEWMDAWWQRGDRPTVSGISVDEGILTIWKQMILEKRRAGEKESELVGYLLRALCVYLDRALKESTQDPKYPFTVYRMKRYIEEQATSPFRVEDVARQVDLSASRAAHLFKEAFNESIMQYTLRVRLNIAVERMKYSALTLEQIAHASGMGSYPYFHRVFKETYGVTPSEYRRRWREEAEAGAGN